MKKDDETKVVDSCMSLCSKPTNSIGGEFPACEDSVETAEERHKYMDCTATLMLGRPEDKAAVPVKQPLNTGTCTLTEGSSRKNDESCGYVGGPDKGSRISSMSK